MNKEQDSELGLSEVTIQEIRELALGSVTESRASDLPEGTRQILLVKGHSLFSSNSLDSQTSGKTSSQSVLLLTGVHSPSSDPGLTKAYITFVDDATLGLRQPSFNKVRGAIYLWLHHRHLPTTLAQIHEPAVYCWVGHFAGGHLYSDVHTGH